jgi:hypothetical protein
MADTRSMKLLVMKLEKWLEVLLEETSEALQFEADEIKLRLIKNEREKLVHTLIDAEHILLHVLDAV